MLKTELVSAVAAKAGISKVDAETAVNATFRLMAQAIQGGRYEFPGFGVFKKVLRKATNRPNPQDRSKRVQTPARYSVTFRPAPGLKGLMNG